MRNKPARIGKLMGRAIKKGKIEIEKKKGNPDNCLGMGRQGLRKGIVMRTDERNRK